MDPYAAPQYPYAQQQYPPPGYYPPPPQVVTKPGGLSSTAHVVNVLACLFTFGLWIPGYILFAVFTPKVRREVIVPYGADPAQVAAAYAAAAPTLEERNAHNRKLFWVVMVVVGVPVCLYALGAIFG